MKIEVEERTYENAQLPEHAFIAKVPERRKLGIDQRPVQLRDLGTMPRRTEAAAVEIWQPFRGQHKSPTLTDLDGTIAETIALHEKAWSIFFKENFGIALAPGEANHFHGSNAEIVARKIGRQLTPGDARFFAEEKERIFRKIVEHEEVVPVPGAREFFRFLSRRGIPMALVTNSDQLNADVLLTRVGLADTLKVRVTADDVKRPKPDPEGYALGVKRLGVDAQECIALEDTPGGVQAALGANLRRVYVVGQTVPRSAFVSLGGVDQTVHGRDFLHLRSNMGIRGKDLDREKDRVSRHRRKPQQPR